MLRESAYKPLQSKTCGPLFKCFPECFCGSFYRFPKYPVNVVLRVLLACILGLTSACRMFYHKYYLIDSTWDGKAF